MGKRKTAAAVLALVFSLFSLSPAYAAEEKRAGKPRFATIKMTAEAPETIHGEYIPVLMYHHFAERDMGTGNGVVTSTKELEEHLKYFKSQGYQVIPLEKLDSLLTKAEQDAESKGSGLNLGEKYLCITMDDGYYSNYELAYPLFKKYKSPASVFAVTDFVTEQTGLRKFTWKQAQEMDKSGWLKVYSHSADHIPVKAGEETDFLACMQKSDATLAEHLKQENVKAMAYPNGVYTEESKRLLEEDGYVLQFTIENGVITRETERNAIPRITVESGMDGRDVVQKIELAAEQAFAAESEGNLNEKEDHCRQLENE